MVKLNVLAGRKIILEKDPCKKIGDSYLSSSTESVVTTTPPPPSSVDEG